MSEEHNLEPPVIRDTFVDKSDQIFIEDDTQSLALTGNIDTQSQYPYSIYNLCYNSQTFEIENCSSKNLGGNIA